MNKALIYYFDMIQSRLDLSKLCTCELGDIARIFAEVDYAKKEEALAALFWIGLQLGCVHAHDHWNYWPFVRSIGDRRVVMVIHGCYTVTFDKWLNIPEHNTSYDKSALAITVCKLGKASLPEWISSYADQFGVEAVTRLQKGIRHDPDIQRLIAEFPFLKEPFNTTNSQRRLE